MNRAMENSVRVKRVLGDGAHYDSNANLDFLAQEGIRPVIMVRRGSAPKNNSS